MGTIISHFWVLRPDGQRTLYEAEYVISPLRPGVLCYVKVPFSERRCACPEREIHSRHEMAAAS